MFAVQAVAAALLPIGGAPSFGAVGFDKVQYRGRYGDEVTALAAPLTAPHDLDESADRVGDDRVG